MSQPELVPTPPLMQGLEPSRVGRVGEVCRSVHKNVLTVPEHTVGTEGMHACVLTMRDITAATPLQGTESFGGGSSGHRLASGTAWTLVLPLLRLT